MVETVTRPAERRLTADYAAFRSARISDVEYHISLDLDSRSPEFAGIVTMTFTLTEPDAPLTVDFTDGVVDKLAINGQTVDIEYNGSFISLPETALHRGTNQVMVEYSHPYSRSGQGLHRFLDTQDGRAYLHTHFEPYDANRLFPCFDQPDLKAHYTVEVTAPPKWTIVSAAAEQEVVDQGANKLWRFPRTGPISTYIFPLHAGEYRVWEADADGIPLRLFARHSLAAHVDPEAWFELTRQGFEFFQGWFDIPYPYSKYDQLIVPEFNIGGMENVAAVTYSESYIRRGRYTRDDMEQLANVLLHEMSHMWFGDLVTPAWWDGLWLKEAFATYMAFLAQAEATRFREAWHQFYSTSKQLAYVADQQVTTHPIEVPVQDTHYAFANFDRITYQKGASVLTQFSHFVGSEDFRSGVRTYLKRHAEGVTELQDFVTAIEESSGRDLTHWVRDWLEQPGLNTLATEVDCRDGTIVSLRVRQAAPENFPILRQHRLQLGLYRWDDQRQRFETTIVPLTARGEVTEVEAVAGSSCPTLVYPNQGDWGFVKVELDPVTLGELPGHVGKLADPLLRSMLWQSLWDMVRDAKLSLPEYGDIALQGIPLENSEKVIRQLAANLLETMHYLWSLPSEHAALKERLAADIEGLAWRLAEQAEPGSDLGLLWLDTYRRVAQSDEAKARLGAMLKVGDSGPKPRLDQDRRWLTVVKLSAMGAEDTDALIASERERDPSETGRRIAMAAESAKPLESIKRTWLERIRDHGSGLSLAQRRAAMNTIFPASQRELHAVFADEIVDSLTQVGRQNEDAFLNSYGNLIPRLCRQENVERLWTAIEEQSDMNPLLYKALRIAHQEEERCLAIAALSASRE
ncbi:MAG: aminopeptidase N [Gammaproteobacteria bacterium]|nr:MAG: aminopeptidase N [Gammaproteobacteria bacterium]